MKRAVDECAGDCDVVRGVGSEACIANVERGYRRHGIENRQCNNGRRVALRNGRCNVVETDDPQVREKAAVGLTKTKLSDRREGVCDDGQAARELRVSDITSDALAGDAGLTGCGSGEGRDDAARIRLGDSDGGAAGALVGAEHTDWTALAPTHRW